jgi:adenylosuccinate synthase
MPVTAVVGCQWGDEGKGKVIDALARDADWVARYQGGANAGHTLRVGGRTRILHLVPSGILHPHVRCVVGNGVVVDPETLLEEIRTLEEEGIPVRGRLFVSRLAHCVTPMHRWQETLLRVDASLGTTRRGVGPAYQDKAARRGFRLENFVSAKRLRGALERAWEGWSQVARSCGEDPLSAPEKLEAIVERFQQLRERLLVHLADTTDLLLGALDRGEHILAEGAQGTLLDLDHGTYPFVTSSTTSAAGVAPGLGIPPSAISEVVGVFKAYTTRVGEGPFPTEMEKETATPFREKADEYGATTGRPRRCGWLDLVLLRRALRLNGVTRLVMTKLDVLGGLSPLHICPEYTTPSGVLRESGASPLELAGTAPVYERLDGWEATPERPGSWSEMPEAMRAYVRRVEEHLGRRVAWVSVGPEREALLRVPSPPE